MPVRTKEERLVVMQRTVFIGRLSYPFFKEAAKMLTITTKQLHYIMETDETFPKPIFLSKRIKRWKKDDISGWLDSKTPK